MGCPQVIIHDDAVLDVQSGLPGQMGIRAHTGGEDDEVGRKAFSALQKHGRFRDFFCPGFGLELDADAFDKALHDAFPDEDDIFEPACSTFEPTRRNANVPNVNTVPGRDVFCFDCRVLPHIPLQEVLKVIDAEIKKISERRDVRITYRFLQKEQAPSPTPSDSPVVKMLMEAIRDVYGLEPHVGGVGGGTCAKYFRDEGIPAAVWCQEADVAHMPNEYAEIEHMVNEAKVFASIMLIKN